MQTESLLGVLHLGTTSLEARQCFFCYYSFNTGVEDFTYTEFSENTIAI